MDPKRLGYQLYACGQNGMPAQIEVDATKYSLHQVFKHDFFAATALYEKDKSQEANSQHPSKIILKINRQHNFLGIPMAWLGEAFCHHQVSILRHLSDLRGIPRFVSCYGRTGFIYEYIEGDCLKEKKDVSDDFFDELLLLLKEVHRRNIAYLDLNKRDNIIVGADGRPYLIDFQISLRIGGHLLFSKRLSRNLLTTLQRADVYHVFKHKRKLKPELLKDHERALSYHSNEKMIGWHRLVATPFRKLRRRFLGYLVSKGVLDDEESGVKPAATGEAKDKTGIK